jgi:hypothetical protein
LGADDPVHAIGRIVACTDEGLVIRVRTGFGEDVVAQLVVKPGLLGPGRVEVSLEGSAVFGGCASIDGDELASLGDEPKLRRLDVGDAQAQADSRRGDPGLVNVV